MRSRGELEGELGRIAQAQWAPLEALEEHAATWPSHEPIVMVDRSGRRAARAQETLRALGMHRVASRQSSIRSPPSPSQSARRPYD